MGGINGIFYSTGKINMIILDHDHIIQTHTDGFLLPPAFTAYFQDPGEGVLFFGYQAVLPLFL